MGDIQASWYLREGGKEKLVPGEGFLRFAHSSSPGASGPSFPNTWALVSLHCRRPLQLFNHYPSHLLAGGSPSPSPLLRMLRWDTEAQHSSLHGRYRVTERMGTLMSA